MKITIDDAELFFDVQGISHVPTGRETFIKPSLLLLHGGPGFDHTYLKPLFSRYSQFFQIIYLDLRGNGRSSHSGPEKWNLNTWATDLYHFCQALYIEKPVVLGHSFGGYVAMEYASRFPNHPSKLILASTTAKTRLDRIRQGFHDRAGKDIAELAHDFWKHPTIEKWQQYKTHCLPLYNTAKEPPESRSTIPMNEELLVYFIAHEQYHMNLIGKLGQIACPTLVLSGRHDPLFSVTDAKDIHDAIPKGLSQFAIFEHSGHNMFLSEPEKAFQTLIQFANP